MEAANSPLVLTSIDHPAWTFRWFTPWRCRMIFIAVVIYNFVSRWHFLTHNCPIDLSGDEAQYWDWSRNLDLSYYSKGPLIAYIIRASCALLGDTMPAVRLPALILAIGTSLCTYWLTKKLFGSDRLALGTFLLGAIVPMFIAGGTLMTIDPPFFFCWALATCLLVKAVMDGQRWAWPTTGLVVGVGFLAKYAMLLWLPFVLFYLAVDPEHRRWLKTIWPWLMMVIALVCTTPVIVWNSQHHWVSFAHVSAQTVTRQSNLLEFVGAQIGIVNPAIAVVMIAAIVYSLGKAGRGDPNQAKLRYLICIGLPFFGICVIDSLFSKVQANWPAPAYFTLLILTAYFISTRMRRIDLWRRWRGWIYGAIAFGVLIHPFIDNATALYPAVAKLNEVAKRQVLAPSRIDLAYKFRGIADPLAKTISGYLKQMPAGSFVLCEDYQDASQMAFYVDGQPKTYFAGSYWIDPTVRRRKTQFDMWPDRQLDRPELIGKDAIYLGFTSYAPLRESFDSVEKLPNVVVRRNGFDIRTYPVWRCRGFHGMSRPPGEGTY